MFQIFRGTKESIVCSIVCQCLLLRGFFNEPFLNWSAEVLSHLQSEIIVGRISHRGLRYTRPDNRPPESLQMELSMNPNGAIQIQDPWHTNGFLCTQSVDIFVTVYWQFFGSFFTNSLYHFTPSGFLKARRGITILLSGGSRSAVVVVGVRDFSCNALFR